MPNYQETDIVVEGTKAKIDWLVDIIEGAKSGDKHGLFGRLLPAMPVSHRRYRRNPTRYNYRYWGAQREIDKSDTSYERDSNTKIRWFILTANGDPFKIFDVLTKEGLAVSATFSVETDLVGRWTPEKGDVSYEGDDIPADLRVKYANVLGDAADVSDDDGGTVTF